MLKQVALACIVMEQVTIYLFIVSKLKKYKAENYEIRPTPLCPGNVAKGFSVGNTNKTVLNRYVYDFSVDYDAIAVGDVLDIHTYLMKKHGIV